MRQFWQRAMDMGIKAVKLETMQLEWQGDTAIEAGKYTLTGEGGQIIDTGKSIWLYGNNGRENGDCTVISGTLASLLKGSKNKQN